jgi:hypothetical protein
MVPWQFFWWVAANHADHHADEVPAHPGPPRERRPLDDSDIGTFAELEHDYWDHTGVRCWWRKRVLVWRCWLATHPALIVAIVLGLVTACVAVVAGVYAIPGMAASTAWPCIVLHRRRHVRGR